MCRTALQAPQPSPEGEGQEQKGELDHMERKQGSMENKEGGTKEGKEEGGAIKGPKYPPYPPQDGYYPYPQDQVYPYTQDQGYPDYPIHHREYPTQVRYPP